MLRRTPDTIITYADGRTFNKSDFDRWKAEWHEEIERLKATAPKLTPRQMTDDEKDYADERRDGWTYQENER
jgi:hypothetical protein